MVAQVGNKLYTYAAAFTNLRYSVWAATTKNSDYVKLQGLKHAVNDLEHRKEFVAGNMGIFLTESMGIVYTY